VTPAAAEPPRDCPLCPRLAAFRAASRTAGGHGGAVSSAGDPAAPVLVVGLAPGLRGAHRTGLPFVGDAAGRFLHAALRRHGFAEGDDDAPRLRGCMVTNAVRCAPPANRPTAAEVATCRPFLAARIAAMPRLRAVLTLGRVAHDSTVRALGASPASAPFAHGAVHAFGPLTLRASYHCSRLNTATGRLTEAMFDEQLAGLRRDLGAPAE
jgi:uracil-DNA glycosylase family 4